MNEILQANFLVFHDLTREQDYDLWIGDEAWELDHYLHENPEHKNAAYAGSPTSSAGCRCPTATRARRP
jgi:hypothetical protein